MKYLVVLCDGMADLPNEKLDGKTPLMAAKKPNIDFLAKNAEEVGLVKTVPNNLSPGSDTANLAVLGYNPEQYLTGRSPYEAVSLGINLTDNDITFRCNLVTLSNEENFDDKVMIDYSADEITTEEAKVLIEHLAGKLNTKELNFFPGITYRHCLRWRNGAKGDYKLTPPHDIIGKKLKDYLPKGKNAEAILSLMEKSTQILKDHPINTARKLKGLRQATNIWLWGMGTKPKLPDFNKKYGVNGAVISAVDLIKGMAIIANMKNIDVEGATGNLNTNFQGKAKAASEAFKSGYDFVFLHFEAPDECGHRGELENKIKAIELIDEKVLGYLLPELKKSKEDYRILVLPDHPTPVSLMTHTNDPVPFLIYDSRNKYPAGHSYDEQAVKKSELIVTKGYTLMDRFIKNRN